LNDSDRRTCTDRQALLVLLVRGGTPRPISLSIFKYTFNLFSVLLHEQNNLFLKKMQNVLLSVNNAMRTFTNGIELTRVLVESCLKIFKDKNNLIIIIISI